MGGASRRDIAALQRIQRTLGKRRTGGLAARHLAVIRRVLSGDVWKRVVMMLPTALLKEAMELRLSSWRKANSLASIAIQILILARAPMRCQSLMSIRIGLNLKEGAVEGDGFSIEFPQYDGRNRLDMIYPLPPDASRLLRQYLERFRPNHVDGDYLFVNDRNGKRQTDFASHAVAATIQRHIGLRITAHQFRHIAAAIILRVRRMTLNLCGDYLGT